jgi:hypothetical protein
LGLLEEVQPQDYFSRISSLPPCIEFIVDFFKNNYPLDYYPRIFSLPPWFSNYFNGKVYWWD